jgi:hypothetical protein
VDLFIVVVAFTNGNTIQIAGDVVGGAGVGVPVGINFRGCGGDVRGRRFLRVGVVHAVPAAYGRVTFLAANLADGMLLELAISRKKANRGE